MDRASDAQLRVGISVGPNGLPLAAAVDLAVRAEAAGLDMVGCGDGSVENFALMGAIASETTTIELVSCALTWARTPATMAAGARTVAELSEGRYRFGVGTMPRAWSENWHGIDYSRPVERMRDYVAATRAALTAAPGVSVQHSGQYYELRDYVAFTEPPSEPIGLYLAPSRLGMARLSGEVADGAIFNVVHSREWLSDVLLPGVDHGLRKAGRSRDALDLGSLVFCSIADSESEAIELLRPGLSFYFGVPYFTDLLRYHGFDEELAAGVEARDQGDAAAATRAVSDRLVRSIALAGTRESVQAELRAYEQLVDWVLLCTPIGQPAAVAFEQASRIISAFGR